MPKDPNADIVETASMSLVQSFAELWFEKAKARDGLPFRDDFPIEDLHPWIGRIIIMDVLDGGKDFRYRLIGTKLVEANRRDLTGKRVSACDYDGGRENVVQSFLQPVIQRKPVFRRGTVTWNNDRSWFAYESVHCPLLKGGKSVDFTIGVQVLKL